jgi:hypothetical protein
VTSTPRSLPLPRKVRQAAGKSSVLQAAGSSAKILLPSEY